MENNQSETARKLVHHSHLSMVDSEDCYAEFELALHHIWEAFSRWSSEVHGFVSNEQMPVHDVSVLQVIRMNERPKSAADIGKFLNRDDSANILYGLRKLERAGLIEKTGGPVRQTAYRVTDRGREVTDQYAAIRHRLLLDNIEAVNGSAAMIEQLTKNIWFLSGLYEQAARTVSVMNVLSNDAVPSVADRAPATKAPTKSKAKANSVKSSATKSTKAGSRRASPRNAEVIG